MFHPSYAPIIHGKAVPSKIYQTAMKKRGIPHPDFCELWLASDDYLKLAFNTLSLDKRTALVEMAWKDVLRLSSCAKEEELNEEDKEFEPLQALELYLYGSIAQYKPNNAVLKKLNGVLGLVGKTGKSAKNRVENGIKKLFWK